MKQILIIGENSYIGDSLARYLDGWDGYRTDSLSSLDEGWETASFSGYDAVFQVAAIVHQKETKEMEPLYDRVNTELACRVAQKAKAEGVGQFLFMSSMSVFGSGVSFIDAGTAPCPDSYYGKSKLRADERLHEMADETFLVLSLRPPMIYGPGCKGNFQRLRQLSRAAFFFPEIENQRSMLFIDNFCEAVRQAVDRRTDGYAYPQNREYVCTAELVKAIRKSENKGTSFTRLFNFIIAPLSKKPGAFQKVFGDLTYDKHLSGDFSYCVADFEESVRMSVNEEGNYENNHLDH